MTLPDVSLARRVAELERKLQAVEFSLARSEKLPRAVQPIAGRLWQFTLNEDFGTTTTHYADADLLYLDGTDTLKDVDVYDGRDQFATLLTSGMGGWCVEQLDVSGARLYVVVQGDCP